MKLDLTGVKGVIASLLIVLSLILGVLNAVQGALPSTVETLGVTNFDTLQVGDGSATEPAFGFTSDTDTGLYRSSANTVGLHGDLNVSGSVSASSLITNGTASLVSVSTSGNITDAGALSVAGATALNGGLSMDTSAFTVADTTGNTVISGTLNVTGTISKGGVAFTGIVKYGTASSYTTGSSITHGFATTPTACLMEPARDVTSTLTVTTTGFSSNRATMATPVYWLCGQ